MAGTGGSGVEEARALLPRRKVKLDLLEKVAEGRLDTGVVHFAVRSVFLLRPVMKIGFAWAHALVVPAVLVGLHVVCDGGDQGGLVGVVGQLGLEIQDVVPHLNEVLLMELAGDLGTSQRHVEEKIPEVGSRRHNPRSESRNVDSRCWDQDDSRGRFQIDSRRGI
jgi:hypothetical protein